MPDGNSLVAQAPGDPDGPGALTAGNGDYGWAGGIGIAESAMDTFTGIKDGNWVAAGLGMVGLAAEGMNAAIDPFGWLMSSVASFLMEHIQPLKDMLDSIAGDPPVIQSYAETWGNVSKHLTSTEENYTNSVKAAKSRWEGGAAEAYQRHADEMTDALKAAASVTDSVSTVTMVFGEVVAFVRELVRDLIADLVGKLISWVLETVFSLGFGTPVVVAQATAAIAKWATKIADLLRRLTDTIRRVSPLLGKLADVLGKITKVFAKVAGKVMGFNPRSDLTPGFIQRPGRGGPDGGSPHGGSGDGGSSSGDGSGNGSDGDGSGSGNGSDGSGSNSGDGPGNNTSPGGSPSPDGPSAGPTRTPGTSSPSSGSPDGSPSGSSPNSPDGGSPGGSSPNSPTNSGGSPSPSTHSPSSPNTAYNSPNSPGTHAPDSTPSGHSPSPHSPDGGSPGGPGPHGGAPSSPASPGPHSPDAGSPGSPGTHTPGSSAPPSPDGGSPSSPGSHGGSPAPHSPAGGSPSSPGTTPHSPGGHSPSTDTPNRPDGTTTPGSTSPGSVATPNAPAPAAPHMPSPRTDSPNSPQTGAPVGGMPASPGGGPGGGSPGGSPGGGSPGGRPPSGWTGTPGRPAPHSPAPHSPAPGPHNRPGPNQHAPAPHSPTRPGPGSPAPHTPGPHSPGPHGSGPNGPGPNGPHSPSPHGAGPQPVPRGFEPGFGPNRPGPGSPNGPGGPRPPHAGGPNQHGPDGHHPRDPRSADPNRKDPNSPDRDPNKPDHDPNAKDHDPNAKDHDPNGKDHDPNNPDSTPDRDPLSPDQVNGRHADQTPAGTSYHRGDPDMGDLPHRVHPDPDGRYTVDVHVTPDGHANIGGRHYTPEQFADILRRNGDYDGRPIRLIGCDAGSNDFAQRLSRELDTPVLAPDRPAWTDSNGRVFSSDYDIGPDGSVRPKVPPTGEWSVHNPDGTTHRASDDGFTPGTKNADKHDIDTESARDRRHPPIDTTKKTAIETEVPHRPMSDKINDPEYRKKYYEENGRRKHERQRDSHEERVPKIEYDKNAKKWVEKPEDPKHGDFEPSTPSNTVDHKATPEQKAAAQKLVDERHAAKTKWDETNEKYWKAKDDAAPHVKQTRDDAMQAARDKYDKAVAKADSDYPNKDTDPGAKKKHDEAVREAAADRKKELADARKAYTESMRDVKIDDALEKDMKQAHRDRTDAGERLGEHSASESVKKDYPVPPNKVENVTPDTPGDKQGAGRFDQVYKVEDANGNVKYVIAEAKGPDAGTGTRLGTDGKRYEQGHPKYVESVIENMKNSDHKAERDLARELRKAQRAGTLEYQKVTAKVDEPAKPKPVGDSSDGPAPKRQKVQTPEYAGHERADYDVKLP